MKQLFFATLIFLSTTAFAKTVTDGDGNKIFEIEIISQKINPTGIISTEISIEPIFSMNVVFSTMAIEKIEGHSVYPAIYGNKQSIQLVSGVKTIYTINGVNLTAGSVYTTTLKAEMTTPTDGAPWEGGTIGGLVTIPEVRKMIVFNTKNVTPSQIVLSSKITTPNIDDIASYEVFDANGNSLMKVTETIFATVDAITFTKSFIIDLVKYPTASSLTTTSSTGGSQKMQLKAKPASAINPTSEVRKDFISSLADEKNVTIFYYDGSSQELPWGEGKFVTTRLKTIQVDGQLVPNVSIFVR